MTSTLILPVSSMLRGSSLVEYEAQGGRSVDLMEHDLHAVGQYIRIETSLLNSMNSSSARSEAKDMSLLYPPLVGLLFPAACSRMHAE